MAKIETAILDTALDPAAELAALGGRDTATGAVASFLGQVRGEAGLTALELEHYPGVTDGALAHIARSAADRWQLSQAVIRHRVGRMAPGDPIVFVAAGAPHRREALEAVSYMIDLLKTEAPFWKRVHTADGSYWINPAEGDRRAANYWLDQMASEDA